MPISLDIAELRRRAAECITEARSRSERPTDTSSWYQRGAAIAQMHYVPRAYLITAALLATSVDARIDPLSLRTRKDDARSYSPRRVAHDAILPVAMSEQVNLLSVTAEPLNAQPFFRYDRLDQIVRARHRESLDTYIAWLSEVGTMASTEASDALIEFLRARLDDPISTPPLRLASSRLLRPDRMPAAAGMFVAARSDGGIRAQAIAAAIMSTVHPETQTHRINSGRDKPGDVYAPSGAAYAFACEVKDKPVCAEAILSWVRSVSDKTDRVLYLAVSRGQTALDTDAIIARAADECGMLLTIFTSIEAAASDHLHISALALNEWAQRFADNGERFLREVGASEDTILEWRTAMTNGDSADHG